MSMEAPEFFHSSYLNTGNTILVPEKRHADPKSGDQFSVEDLLDFSNEDVATGDGGNFDVITGNSNDSSTVTVVESCESSFSGNFDCQNFPDADLTGELCVPYDELAELEWFSNFMDESFSNDELQKLQLISEQKNFPEEVSEARKLQLEREQFNSIIRSEMSAPGKARSKRSRAAPCNWSSRLIVLSPTISSSESDTMSDSGNKTTKATPKKKEDSKHATGNGERRKCLHCATDKTPQWRTGPMGPKTLCNACGVRYKSGRLVPEYRPASSPTFLLTKHSNSHRKVLELRRQKELQRIQQQPFLYPNPVLDEWSCGDDDYLIHQHSGPDFRQLI